MHFLFYYILLANTFCQEAYYRNKAALVEIKKGTKVIKFELLFSNLIKS